MASLSRELGARNQRTQLSRRRLLVCGTCGWVHYAATAEEKAVQDRALERYQLTWSERREYESSFRQCLRCEAPAGAFRAAQEPDLARAAGHLVTPILLDD